MAATDRAQDARRFRPPASRDVALTGARGHKSVYATPEGIMRRHLDPGAALAAGDPAQVVLPEAPRLAAAELAALDDRLERARLAARIGIEAVTPGEAEAPEPVAFLRALTGGGGVNGRLRRSDAAPSGLKVDR